MGLSRSARASGRRTDHRPRWLPALRQTLAVSDLSAFAKFVPEDHGLVVVSTTRADGSVQSSVVNAGVMASDDPTGGAGGVQGMMVNYSVTDTGEAKRIFDALAEGGEVRLPLGPTSWSPAFGMCVDRFGTSWLFNIVGGG